MELVQFEDWMLPTVKELVQTVARAFYSDEHVVVLDMLTQYRMIREDKLDTLFHLSCSQLAKALGYLTTEKLVCRMEVKETRSNKKARLAGVDGTPAPAAPSKQYDDSDSEYIDSDEEVKRAKNKLKVTVYYINPCYFVDCVRYRIWRIKTALQQQERSNENKKAYECVKCARKYTELEALQYLMTSRGATAMAKGASSGEMDFKCSACNSPLAQLDVGAVVTSIGQTLIQFEQAIKLTKIQALLDKLAGVELEGNHPDEHILKGWISMLEPDEDAGHIGATVIAPTVEIKVDVETLGGVPVVAPDAARLTAEHADILRKLEEDNLMRAIRAEAEGDAKPLVKPAVSLSVEPVGAAGRDAPVPGPVVKPEIPAQPVHAAAAEPEATEAQDDVVVYVNGVPKPLSAITEADELLMTPEEYEKYSEYL